MFKDWSKLNIIVLVFGIVSNALTVVAFYFSLISIMPIAPITAIIIISCFNITMAIFLYFALKDGNNYYKKYIIADEKEKNYESIIYEKNKFIEEKINEFKKSDLLKESEKECICLIVHNIYHEYRCILKKLILEEKVITERNYINIKKSFDMYISYILMNTQKLLEKITKEECSVCIKIIIDNDNVTTFMRDNISYNIRSKIDSRMIKFPIRENTAFINIVDENNPDTIFICNDLGANRNYNNQNPEWSELYNSTLVVPIRYRFSSKGPDSADVLGFLCTDSLNAKFDSKVCTALLSAFGDSLYNLFLLISEFKIIEKQEKEAA